MASSVIEKSLAAEVATLSKAPSTLVDTAYPNSTEAISYPCDWTKYRYLIVAVGAYGNVQACAIVPRAYFNSTTSGSRVQLFTFTSAGEVLFYSEVYKNGDNAIYIRLSVASNYARTRIWGIE